MTEFTESLTWPPRADDLKQLYLNEGLSAMKIAKLYGLNYASEKTAESTILYHLKKNGIERRDCADHVRKVTEEMVDEWVRRYESGESLKTISGGKLSPVTVFLHLRKRGVRLRDKIEAQIQAVTKHEKKPFTGTLDERYYLMGFTLGDLNIVRHGRAIRARTSTTHPGIATLFDELFGKYGFVHRYPRENKLTGYEWSLEVDLDKSFDFLLLAKQTKKSSSSTVTLFSASWQVSSMLRGPSTSTTRRMERALKCTSQMRTKNFSAGSRNESSFWATIPTWRLASKIASDWDMSLEEKS